MARSISRTRSTPMRRRRTRTRLIGTRRSRSRPAQQGRAAGQARPASSPRASRPRTSRPRHCRWRADGCVEHERADPCPEPGSDGSVSQSNTVDSDASASNKNSADQFRPRRGGSGTDCKCQDGSTGIRPRTRTRRTSRPPLLRPRRSRSTRRTRTCRSAFSAPEGRERHADELGQFGCSRTQLERRRPDRDADAVGRRWPEQQQQ